MATNRITTNAPVWAPFAVYGFIAALVALFAEA